MAKNNLENDTGSYLQYNKRIFIAAAITSIIVLGGLGGLAATKINKPTVSTIYYHYNIQYRCGMDNTYNEICTAVSYLSEMYEDHPNWNYTIECQFMLLEWMHDYFPDNFSLIKTQNQRGQLELVVPQYSDGWHVPYPLKDFYDSINYTQCRMEEYGLTPSRLIILQEGQWLPGITEIGDMGGFDAAVLHIEQSTYFGYYPEEPILRWTYDGKEKYALVNPRLPSYEAGVWHHQIYAADGELLNTGDVEVHGGPAAEFEFNEAKQKNHENKLLELEKRGNLFMTMEQFFDFAIQDEDNIADLDKFLPECEWVATNYEQYFTWMGKGSAAPDDGTMIARNYEVSQLIKATEVLLNQAFNDGSISAENYTEWGPYRVDDNDGLLLEAKKHLWEAQVSDTTGINPNYWEWWYGLNHTDDAYDLVYEIIEKVRSEGGASNPYDGLIQINPYQEEIYTSENNFINQTVLDDSLTVEDVEAKFGFNLEVSQTADFDALGYGKTVSKCNYNTSDWNMEYYSVAFDFYGQNNMSMRLNNTVFYTEDELEAFHTVSSGEKNDISVKFEDDWQEAVYSPALAENTSVKLNRDDYWYYPHNSLEEWRCLLSLCNGMLYNPQEGYAIVKNCTANHIAANWRTDNVEFLETQVKYNMTKEYFIVEGELADILQFANQINSYAPLTLEAIL